ncbi:MAG: 4Fe-4S cluster-binding domain-containing protein [Zetaproteobacteria bacterium]|nr:4Fe-4S cluster-binding domain-containing protein [Zetaproteobacteria bacterium]
MALTLRIHEIYQSIQGESTLAGTPCTFIRLAGCPLRCRDCDTPQALATDSGKTYTIEAILKTIAPLTHQSILVTGGEPLAQKNSIALLEALGSITQHLQLETSGAYAIDHIPPHVQIILDIKTPESGESQKNRWHNLEILKATDEIKCVIYNRADYQWCKAIIGQYKLDQRHTVLLSPAWNALDPKDLVTWILEDELKVRLQIQQHKYIWDEGTTGV